MKKMSEKLDGFGIPLMEMSNAIQRYTGLPGVVYFCTKEEMNNPQAHALGRIKWLHAGKDCSVSIKRKSDGNRKVSGDHRMVAQLEKFVELNEELLWEYWNTPKDLADSVETQMKFIRV